MVISSPLSPNPQDHDTADRSIDSANIKVIDDTENGLFEGFDDSVIARSLRNHAKQKKKSRKKRIHSLRNLKIPRDSMLLKAIERRTSTIFIYAATENSTLFEMTDEDVDPLMWTGTMGWRWYTGFLTYTLMTLVPPMIGFAASNILHIRDSNEHPLSWWKCGIFCGVVWSLVLNCFTFIIIRTKLRTNPDYDDFNPSWGTMLLCWLGVGVFMNLVWIGLY